MIELCKNPEVREKRSRDRLEYLSNPASRAIISNSCKEFWKNSSREYRNNHSESTSSGRLSMTEEAKLLRANRVSESFKTSELRKEFEDKMRIDRIGEGNPNSRPIVWYGKTFISGSEFSKFIKTTNISRAEAFRQLSDKNNTECYKVNPTIREPVSCKWCGLSSTNPSSIHRWHNDNCKHKVNAVPSKSSEQTKETTNE